MTPQDIQSAVEAVALAVLGGAAAIGLPALWKWFAARLDNATKREAQDITHDTKEDALDLETRDIANKLALTALDKEQQLQRLKHEYEQQSELVRTQAAEIARLTADLGAARERIEQLVGDLTNAIAQIKVLETEIAILETMGGR